MHQEQGLNPALKEVESLLGQARPSRAGLDRDVLLFRLGLASARPSRIWQTLSGVLALLLLCAVLARPSPETSKSMNPRTYVQGFQVPAPEQAAEALGQMAYLRVRQQVLSKGLDALPKDPGAGKRNEPDRREYLETILSS
jgi:hypothetical protein